MARLPSWSSQPYYLSTPIDLSLNYGPKDYREMMHFPCLKVSGTVYAGCTDCWSQGAYDCFTAGIQQTQTVNKDTKIRNKSHTPEFPRHVDIGLELMLLQYGNFDM